MSYIPWIHMLVLAPLIAALVFLPKFPDAAMKPWLYGFFGLVLVYQWISIYKNPERKWLWIHVTVIVPILMARVLLPSTFLFHLCRALLGALLFYHFVWIVTS